MVATSQPLAAQAGLRMLQAGGNAIDAALAAAIALTVVEPTSNGIGGDAFAILWDGKQLHGLNASGRSPQALTPERFNNQKEMPLTGWDTVTVPGAVNGWAELSQRFGQLEFTTLFEPAIEYATNGFLVGPQTAAAWTRAVETYRDYPEFAAAFLPNGTSPKAGQVFRFPEQATTLRQIAESHGTSFYTGELAERIIAHASSAGAPLSAVDLAEHQSDWCGTIHQAYHEYELHQIPPNGQGLAALIALGILQHHPVRDYPLDSADFLHVQIEAMKLALADAYQYIADPAAMQPVTAADLLKPEYLSERAALINMTAAQEPNYGVPAPSGTVYVTTADAQGNQVSLIQSNYRGFGSGIVVPDTGISLQNRGAGFVLEPNHPNHVGPNKRPFHTIIPGFLTRGGQPVMSFGVIGGFVQPQIQAQFVIRLRDYGQNPQAITDAPRWYLSENKTVVIEPGFSTGTLQELERRGQHLEQVPGWSFEHFFGGAQAIYKLKNGYLGASDHRREGHAVGF